jgi:hypothetical protein
MVPLLIFVSSVLQEFGPDCHCEQIQEKCCSSSFCDFSRPTSNVAKKREHEQDHKNKEKNFGNASGRERDTSEAQDASDQRHYEEDESPAQHCSILPIAK